jgi:predicted enzyme related to lactoylglutathione lyase
MKPVAYYITVSDMTESLAFYSRVFNKKPDHVEERYSRFEMSGFWFGLFSASFEDRKLVYGNNCALCFKVADIKAEYKRLKEFVPQIDANILALPTVSLFQFQDSDGNLIEIFQENA